MNGQLPDFDTLVQLAESDPAALEALRDQHVRALIADAPEHMQRRLEGLQFQIDAKRQVAKNSMEACISVSSMMHESFEKLRTALNNCVEGAIDEALFETPTINQEDETAKILSFQTPAAAN